MTTEPIDHAESARNLLEFIGKNALTDSQALVSIGAAQVHAAMASVAAQERANELKRIEVLALLARIECENVSTPTDALDTLYSRHPDTVFRGSTILRTRPSIARSLGLGGESDGE